MRPAEVNLVFVIASAPVDEIPQDPVPPPRSKPHTAKKASNVHLNNVAGLANPGGMIEEGVQEGVLEIVFEEGCVKG